MKLRELLSLDYASTDNGPLMTSPAAYFFDMMRVATSRVQINAEETKKRLLCIAGRRPDLLDIPLDEANTTEEKIPTLSLINYIMARHVVPDIPRKLLGERGISSRTTAALMKAYRDEALHRLRVDDADAFHWPFSLEEEQEVAYLEGLGTSTYHLACAMTQIRGQREKPSDPGADLDFARKYLGFSRAMVRELKYPRAVSDVENGVSSLEFCDRAHITYERLCQLLRVGDSQPSDSDVVKDSNNYFINLGMTDPIVLILGETGEGEKGETVEKLENLSSDRVIRIGVFHRLAEHLNWAVDELEHVLAVFGVSGPGISEEQLVQLANVKRLQDTVSLPVTAVANILTPSAGNASLNESQMERLFLDGDSAVTADKLGLTFKYLALLKAGADHNALFEDAKQAVSQLPMLTERYSDERLGKDYFMDDFASVFKRICKVSGLTKTELVVLANNDALIAALKVSNSPYLFLHFVYSLGCIKKVCNRTADDIFKLFCLENHGGSIPESVVQMSSLISTDNAKCTNLLLSLKESGDLVKNSPCDLDEFLYLCCGVRDPKKAECIQKLLENVKKDPIIQGLKSHEGRAENSEAYKLMKISCKGAIQANLAKLFGVTPSIFNRVFVALDTDADSTLLDTLLGDDTIGSTIELLDRSLSVSKAYRLKESDSHSKQYSSMQAISKSLQNVSSAVEVRVSGLPETNIAKDPLLESTANDSLLPTQGAVVNDWIGDMNTACDFFEQAKDRLNSYYHALDGQLGNLDSESQALSSDDAEIADLQSLQEKIAQFSRGITAPKNANASKPVSKETPSPKQKQQGSVSVDSGAQSVAGSADAADASALDLQKEREDEAKTRKFLQSSNEREIQSASLAVSSLKKEVNRFIESQKALVDSAIDRAKDLLGSSVHDIDDVSLFTELLHESGSAHVLSFKSFDSMQTYIRTQKSLEDPENHLLRSVMLDSEDNRDIALAKVFGLGVASWARLNKGIMPGDESMICKIEGESPFLSQLDQMNRLMVLKSLLDSFDGDSDLVLWMSDSSYLGYDKARTTLDRLGSVLEHKNPDAYDSAIRGLAEKERDYLLPAVLRRFQKDPDYSQLKITTVRALSDYLLVDVTITGRASTTPIIRGHASLQRYLHRCRMGLESDDYGLSISTDIPEEQWKWLSHYRLWQDNREIFLYPENYLGDGPRTTKSEQFEMLSRTMQKPQYDDDLLGDAYRSYVTKMDKIGSLKIVSVCRQPLSEDVTSKLGGKVKLHIIGATRTHPEEHYHMTVEGALREPVKDVSNQAGGGSKQESLVCDDLSNWTYWKQIPSHIKSSHHSVLATWAYDRLYLHWIHTHHSAKGLGTGDSDSDTSTKWSDVTISQNAVLRNKLSCMYQLHDGTWSTAKVIAESFGKVVSKEAEEKDIADARGGLALAKGRFKKEESDLDATFGLLQTYFDNVRNSCAFIGGGFSEMFGFFHVHGKFDTSSPHFSILKDLLGKVNAVQDKLRTYYDSKVEFAVDEEALEIKKDESGGGKATKGKQVLEDYKKELKDLLTEYATALTKVEQSGEDGGKYTDDEATKPSAPSLWDDIDDYIRFVSTYAKAMARYEVMEDWNKDVDNLTQLADKTDYEKIHDSLVQALDAHWMSAVSLRGAHEQMTAQDELKAILDRKRDPITFDRYGDLHTFVSLELKNAGAPEASVGSPEDTEEGKEIPQDTEEGKEIEGILTVDLIHVYMDEQKKSADFKLISPYFPIGEPELTAFLQRLHRQLDFSETLISALVAMEHNARANKFELDSPWGQYYWEMMYFIPMLIAEKLQSIGEFKRAREWYRVIFNPSHRQGDIQRSPFVFAPFVEPSSYDVFEPLTNQRELEVFHKHPFDAHRMARIKGGVLPYKRYTVRRFVENLLDWGDSLFTRATREDEDDADIYYEIVLGILGPTPRKLASVSYDANDYHKTFDDLYREARKDEVLRRDRQEVVASKSPYPYNYSTSYFKVPENRDMMALWDRVNDRVYKLRHSLGIDGAYEDLPLLSPEIDPHQLARSVAEHGGEFFRGILNQLSGQRHTYYRFMVLIVQAKSLTNFVSRLESALLSALEREDASKLVLLQNQYSASVLDKTTELKEKEIDQANQQINVLKDRDASIQMRIEHYQGLLNNGGMIEAETGADVSRQLAIVLHGAAAVASTAAQAIGAAPQVGLVGPYPKEEEGGMELFRLTQAIAAGIEATAIAPDFAAQTMDRSAFYQRRNEEWSLQFKMAKSEKKVLSSQKKAADISLAVVRLRFESHKLAVSHQRDVDNHYSNRFTKGEMYHWLSLQLYQLCQQAYGLAESAAQKAAQAYEFERGKPSGFSSTGFWSSSRKGLHAGEQLEHALNTMKQSYMDSNERWHEVEKVVSLRVLFSKARAGDESLSRDHIQELWEKGFVDDLTQGKAVSFVLPESVFDGDFKVEKGSFKRRIMLLSVSVPALAAPDQQVALKLVHRGSGEFILISRGSSDTGTSAGLHDERYLPFEGLSAGDSSWTLELGNPQPMDPESTRKALYDSIHDIKLHIRYQMQPIHNSSSTVTPPARLAL